MKRLAVAILAVLALSACAVTGQPARPGTAATYEGTTITNGQVAAWGTAQNGLGSLSKDGLGRGYDPGAVLTMMLLRPALEKEAAREGIFFGDEQIAAEAQMWMDADNAAIVTPTADMMDVVRLVRTFEALIRTDPGVAAIQAELLSIETNAVVNPEYGEFTFDQFIASFTVQARVQQDQAVRFGDVNYLFFKDVSGFNANIRPSWMVDEGQPAASPSASPAP